MTKIGEKTGTVKWESKIRMLKDGKVHMGMAIDASTGEEWPAKLVQAVNVGADAPGVSRALRRQSQIRNGISRSISALLGTSKGISTIEGWEGYVLGTGNVLGYSGRCAHSMGTRIEEGNVADQQEHVQSILGFIPGRLPYRSGRSDIQCNPNRRR
jgi:hypothetical protein